MKKSPLTTEGFEILLKWLDPDRETAGEKYEEIHFKLTKIFARRGCNNPEELADKTIDRVIQKITEIASSYRGDPKLYFYGVAKNIFLEYVKAPTAFRPLPQPYPPDLKEQQYRCLDECLTELGAEKRAFILQYYEGEKRSKIRRRKELADSLGITLVTLRTRMQRLKATLRKCVKDCLARGE
jgi:RNA polymerase sigma factor (sigma-70 family)